MVDTNLLISALLFPHSTLASNIFAAADKFSLIISTQILDELRTVVKRKFPNKANEMEMLLRQLHVRCYQRWQRRGCCSTTKHCGWWRWQVQR